MIAYDWNCKTVDVHPQEEGETDVVYNVHWIVTGVDGDYSANCIGTQVVPLSEGGTFIPFEDLTNDVVVDWTKEAMGEEQVTQIETSVASEIEGKINPTSVTMTIGE
jgi:hypothetical protein|tara:strand:+ start:2519 stop:2839 length:321 start_codon:yes stop_codon:yes gene_type:complete